jgi:hypothetical protein
MRPRKTGEGFGTHAALIGNGFYQAGGNTIKGNRCKETGRPRTKASA